MKKKTKVIVVVAALALVLPLTVLSLARETGVFDTRSSAASTWEECEYSKADLDQDGEVSIKDFHLWLGIWREYKACQRDTTKCAVGCVDSSESTESDDLRRDIDNRRDKGSYDEGDNEGEEEEEEEENTNDPSQGDSTVVIRRNNLTLRANYQGEEQWEYTITGSLPTPCYQIQETDITRDEDSNVTTIDMNIVVSGDACIQVIQEVSEEGTFTAPEDTEISFEVTQTSSKGTPPANI